MNVADTFEHGDLTARLLYDDTGSGDPRDFDNLSHLYCWHPEYMLGDEQFKDGEGRGAVKDKRVFKDGRWQTERVYANRHDTVEEVFKHCREQGATVIVPLFLYEHSGITISAGPVIEKLTREAVDAHGRFMGDSQGWDTSWVGFAYATEKRRKVLGVPRSRKVVEEAMRSEIEEYDRYLRGEVYGYVIEHPGFGELDSLWGLLGYEYAMESAREAAKDCAADVIGKELNRAPVEVA